MARPRSLGYTLTLAVMAAALAPRPTRADEADRPEPRAVSNIQQAVEDGAFAVLAMPARVGSTSAFALGLGGYDSARKGAVADAIAEVRLWGPVALRGGATYDASGTRMRPNIGGRIQVLRQELGPAA